MTKSLKILPLLFLFLPVTSFSQTTFFSEMLEIVTDEGFTVFNDFIMVEESTFLLINNRGKNYSVKTYNQNKNSIENRFARHGRGPGEINQLGAFTLDEKKRHVFLSDFNDLRIKKYTLDGEVTLEKPVPIRNIISLTHSDSTIIATTVLRFLTSETEGEKELLSILIDDKTLEVMGALYFNLDELNLREEIENYQRLESIDLYPTTIQVQSDLYIVVFESINNVFLINSDSEIIDQVSLPIPNYQMVEVTRNPQFGYGYRPSKVFYDFVMMNDRILFTFGDRSLDIPFGVANIEIENNKLSWSLSNLSNPERLTQEEFFITSHNEKIWAFDGDKFKEIQFSEID